MSSFELSTMIDDEERVCMVFLSLGELSNVCSSRVKGWRLLGRAPSVYIGSGLLGVQVK